jgi:putative sigma-54 modulation protein
MTFTITGRNVNVSDRLHDYMEKKLPRIEKFFHQLMEVRVILVTEKQDHIAEMVVVGDGARLYGQETGGDFYSALDLLIDKIEKQVSRFKEKHQLHKGTHLGEVTLVNANTDEITEITVEKASAKPVDETEAYLQMKLDGRDFILFRKGEKSIAGGAFESNSLALLFKSGGGLRLAEISCGAKSGACDPEVREFDVKIVEDSPTKPKIKCTKAAESVIDSELLIDAVREIVDAGKKFVPFVNIETGFLNVAFKEGGKTVGVLVPASE